DSHLGVAHFHPEAAVKGTADFTYTTTQLSVLQGADNTSSIVLGAGRVDPGDEFRLSNALIHERNYVDANMNPVLRTFDLVLTPTPAPEPSSLTLLVLGTVGVAGYGWSRWKVENRRRRIGHASLPAWGSDGERHSRRRRGVLPRYPA